MTTYNRLKRILADDASSKYKPSDFGYYWTIEKGKEDIEGKDFKGDIFADGMFSDNITNLYGCPKTVSGDFKIHCFGKLISLEGAPEYVGGDFECNLCNTLKNLKGAPKK